MVSVIITSYNRGDVVKRAIDSVLAQNTTFPVEIIVVDDGSTDNSREVLMKYVNHGDILLRLNKHMGLMDTYIDGFGHAKGKYIAVCDCDDYWINPNKLQAQYDFMEANKDYSICCTLCHVEDINGVCKSFRIHKNNFTFNDLLRNCFIFTPTVMFRRDLYKNYADLEKFKRFGFFIWDYPIFLELSKRGRIACLHIFTSVLTVSRESFTRTFKRSKRMSLIFGTIKIKLYFMLKYGCSFSAFFFVVYRFTRDIYSLIFKRWRVTI